MNVLILTGRFGMGHVKCAQAIKENMIKDNQKANVNVVDFCDYCFPKLSNAIYKAFEICVFKFSATYNRLGSISNHINCVPFKSFIASRIDSMIEDYKPDLIVADLPMCVQYISSYRKRRKSKIPFYVYITDITIHSDWISKGVDKYFVGDSVCKNELISHGIQEKNIHISGIPVSPSFYIKEKDVSKTKKVLIMGGGLGLIPCYDVILGALNKCDNVETTVICGKNIKLMERINKDYPSINAIGYTNNVSSYLKESDVIITKPGGITTFEAISAQTPLYIIEPTLEQELGNSDFIARHNLGTVIATGEDFSVNELIAFINNHELLNQIKRNMKRVIDGFESSNPLNYLEVA